MADAVSLRTDAGVAYLTVDFPPLNLMGGEVLTGLTAALDRVEADDTVKVVVLESANPDFFIAHGDVAGMVGMPMLETAARSDDLSWTHGLLDRFRTMPKVTIAKVAGYARGGGAEAALACDMRYAAKGKAVFGQPEIGLGILPGGGGAARLMRIVGRARAAEIVFSGDDYSAEEAERLGWINRALPPDELGPFVEALARRIARFPAKSIAEIKRVFEAVDRDLHEDLKTEQHAFDECMTRPEPGILMQRWMDAGMQTPEGEKTIGKRLPDLSE